MHYPTCVAAGLTCTLAAGLSVPGHAAMFCADSPATITAALESTGTSGDADEVRIASRPVLFAMHSSGVPSRPTCGRPAYESRRPEHCIGQAMFWAPPMYGHSTSCTLIESTASWPFSF